MIKTVFIHIALFFNIAIMYGQIPPSIEYNFDAINLNEASGLLAPISAELPESYICGVGNNSNALLFDGVNDTIQLPLDIKEYFEGDFTLSFYFWVDSGLPVHTLLSIQNSCARDSSLTIKFVETTNELRLEYARSLVDFVDFNIVLDANKCWHQVIFSRSGDTYSFYVDNEFIANQLFVDDIALGRNFIPYLGFSDCAGTNDNGFFGSIDNFALYNRAVDDQILVENRYFPDAIISVDTTLFQGDSYQINTGASCAPNIQWGPFAGVDDPTSATPIVTPDITTSYNVSFDHGNCISRDTVTVFIVDDDDIDCSNLLLPKAFTPNNDGLNDTYGISNNFIISNLNRYEIYDRWGLKLYESNEKTGQWDGTYNGSTLMPGTYVYKIEYECLDENFRKTGSFNLIK